MPVPGSAEHLAFRKKVIDAAVPDKADAAIEAVKDVAPDAVEKKVTFESLVAAVKAAPKKAAPKKAKAAAPKKA